MKLHHTGLRLGICLAVIGSALGGPALLPAAAQVAVQPAFAPGYGSYTAAVESSRQAIWDRMEAGSVPGLSVAVWAEGELQWAEGFGFADLEQRVPVEPETKFRIASISKALAAAGVGVLMQEGRLDLDLPVQRYVPEFPEKRWPVTTRQIAGHIGGVRHYAGDEFASAVAYDDVVDALEIFADSPLQSEPGTEYSYSTYGWNLVSAVMQGAAGEPFLDFMRSRVIEPLGLNETIAEHVDSLIPGRARFYQSSEGHIVNAPYVNNSNKWAGGGYLSTARDMVRYGASYLTNEILSPQTVTELWTPLRPREGTSIYGIGWNHDLRDGVDTAWHTGGAMGGTTILIIQPERGIVVALLTNLQGVGGLGATADQIANFFAGAN